MKALKLSILLSCVYLASCVDNKYDLSNVNTEVSWGGDALTIPLVSTKKILLDEMLDDESRKFIKEMNGVYGLTYETNIPASSVDVPEIKFSIDNQDDSTKVIFTDFDFNSFVLEIDDHESVIDLNLPEPSLPSAIIKQLPQKRNAVKIRKLTKSDPIKTVIPLEFSLSPAITGVRKLNFKDNALMSIRIIAEDANGNPLPQKVKEKIKVENFSISLASIVECRSSDPNFSSNQYTFPNGTIPSGFSVNINAINFGQTKTVQDGLLKFDLSYTTQGKAFISDVVGLTLEELTMLQGARMRQVISIEPLQVENADIDLAEISFKTEGTIQWGNEPITGVTDFYKDVTSLRLRGEEILFNLKVDIENNNLLKYGDLHIPVAQITLPKYMFAGGKHVLTFKNLTIDKNTGEITTPIKAKLDSLYFADGREITNGNIIINENPDDGNIHYFFEVVKPAQAANVDEFNNELDIRFSMNTGEQKITHILGHISKEMNYKTEMSLHNLPEFLKNENNNLLFSNMHMEFEINHNIGFPIRLGIVISPVGQNGEIIEENEVRTDNLSIKVGGAKEKELQKVKLWIAANDLGMPEGFTFVKMSNISNLFRQVPKTLLSDIVLTPDPDSFDFIEADKTYFMEGEGTFKVPFVFESGFKLYYDTKIKLEDVLTDEILDLLFSNSNNELQLLINFHNTIPLHLIGSFVGLDENDQPLTNVTVTPNSSKPANILPGTEENEKVTPIIVSIKGDKDQIKKLKQLKTSLLIEAKEGESTAGGAAITTTNGIRMEIKGRVLGNITIK